MGKPAARLTDSTAHGGLVTGPGCPTVLIGKMPAATMGDMHVCPMLTPGVPPIPHVGGPITLGSTGVFIGKKPAARLGDMCVCVGPPSTIIMGCMTVLIGEVGSGSQAASAASALAAQAAKATGPKSLKAGDPPPVPEVATENHIIDCEFTDAAGKPLAGVGYRIKDPNGMEIAGGSTVEGKGYHPGYAKAGSFEIHVLSLKNAKWKKSKVKMGEAAEFSVEADLFGDHPEVYVNIYQCRGGLRRWVASQVLPVKGGKAEGKWQPSYEELGVEENDADAADATDAAPPTYSDPATYEFVCDGNGVIALSDDMHFVDDLEIELLDAKNKGVPNADYEVEFPSGEVKKGKLDGSGKAKLTEVEPSHVKIRFPGEDEKQKEKEKAAGSPSNSSSGKNKNETDEKEDTGAAKKKPPDKLDMRFPLDVDLREIIKTKFSYREGERQFGAPRNGGKRAHAGCDLYAPLGTPIYAVADGTFARYANFYDQTWEIEINHGEFTVRYGEVQPPWNQASEMYDYPPDQNQCKGMPHLFKRDEIISKGQLIGWIGELRKVDHNGNVKTIRPMLHFEMYYNQSQGLLTDYSNLTYDFVSEKKYMRRKDLLNPATFLDQSSDA